MLPVAAVQSSSYGFRVQSAAPWGPCILSAELDSEPCKMVFSKVSRGLCRATCPIARTASLTIRYSSCSACRIVLSRPHCCCHEDCWPAPIPEQRSHPDHALCSTIPPVSVPRHRCLSIICFACRVPRNPLRARAERETSVCVAGCEPSRQAPA